MTDSANDCAENRQQGPTGASAVGHTVLVPYSKLYTNNGVRVDRVKFNVEGQAFLLKKSG